ncbi:MAG: penicillin-binding transpeptidase domain-containing protein [Clostridium sp.]|nr:penicillin-binding transpeptidase domain-containing protein [Clostridium sp.]
MNNNKNINQRFFVVIVLMSLGGLFIFGNACYLVLAESGYWEEVSKQLVKENVPIPANRGNILSSDGQLMTSSLPEYKIYMDFIASDKDTAAAARLQQWRDSMLTTKMDSICDGLHRIFPDVSAKEFRQRLEKGRKLKRRNWLVYKKRISYIQYKDCKELPLFREKPFKGGFYTEEFNQRKKPFGSLATRTLGALYASKDSARNGLELAYDSILRGQAGTSHRAKVRNKWLSLVDKPPVDGNDIVSTIDISMQDAAEKALIRKLKEIGGDVGVVVLMEVATGDVKAIVNMTKCSDGVYREVKNNAVSDMMEPGSTFKTASIMVALEDKKITKNDFIETGNGQWNMHGRVMKDHNWRRGGYGQISIPEVLMYSSNIGVSRVIDDHYKDHPEQFVDGLYREGVGIPLDLALPGSGKPNVRRPKKDGSNWSKTALPWMSIGYETQIPPIYTVTFYNAIANGGKMVKPRFVKAEMRNGEIVREFPVEVIKERICSPSTLKDIQEILELVVSKGLGKKAGCKQFKVSGKTGTAQVAQGGGYHSGAMKYLVSFCGYFPSDAPRYSCIVAIQKSGLPASGGGQCGPVFSEIAQAVMVKGVYRDAAEATDSASVFVPDVLNGNLTATREVLRTLNIKQHQDWQDDDINGTVWGESRNNGNNVSLKRNNTPLTLVPDVSGMGARDAVYALEQRGLHVRLKGSGRVVKQSIAPHTKVNKGKQINLELK